jgi:hypothetical protein
MTSDEAVLAVIQVLDDIKLPYMLVGSFSSNYYGVARSTKDADFVVQVGDRAVRDVTDRLGPDFQLDPQMYFETVTMTTPQVVTAAATPFRIEFFHLSDEAHDLERFQRRRRANLLGRAVWLPTAEDVIITKLRWARGRHSKDGDDVRNVIALQGDHIDWDYVHSWCDRHGTRELLDEIRRSIPPI